MFKFLSRRYRRIRRSYKDLTSMVSLYKIQLSVMIHFKGEEHPKVMALKERINFGEQMLKILKLQLES